MPQIYLAGPWFTPDQLRRLEMIKTLMDDVGITYYSPKDECLFENGKDIDPKSVLQMNVNAIHDCEFVLAITDGKDPGTLWECGYAYAEEVPIVYVWLTHEKGQKFNLMLAASGACVCLDARQITDVLYHINETNSVPQFTFEGLIE